MIVSKLLTDIMLYDETYNVKYICSPSNVIRHAHTLEELVLVRSGESTLITDSMSQKMHGQYVVFAPRLAMHYQINRLDITYQRFCIKFDISKLRLVTTPQQAFAFEVTSQEFDQLCYWIEPLLQLYQSNEVSVFAEKKRDNLLSLIMNDLICFAKQRNILEAVPPPYLLLVRDYIEEHFNEKTNLSELASRFFISKTKLTQDFKAEYHMTVTEYITAVRLNRSIDYLISGMPLNEIAINTGFQSANYYIRVFEKKFKVTPSKYRSNYLSSTHPSKEAQR